jgi:hypothetical protein
MEKLKAVILPMGNWCQRGDLKGVYAHGEELTFEADDEWTLELDELIIRVTHTKTEEIFGIPLSQARYMVMKEKKEKEIIHPMHPVHYVSQRKQEKTTKERT